MHNPNTPDSEVAAFKKGDVVLNGYASPGFNDLHIVVGSTSRKTGPYSVSKYYQTRMLFKGKLQSISLLPKRDNKLTKIGHVDYEKYIIDEMQAFLTTKITEQEQR